MSYNGFKDTLYMGEGGLDLSRNKTAIARNKLIFSENIEIIEGMTGKEGGSTNANSSAISGSPSVIAGIDYYPTAGTQRLVIATSDGKLYKDDGTFTFGTTLKSGLGTSKVTQFVEGGAEATGNSKHLFCFNGNDPVQVLTADGITTANIATPPADWTGTAQPVAGCLHNLRLWGIRSHFLYGSTTTNHEDFTGAGSQLFPVWPGEGEELYGIVSVFGRLFLFKKQTGIYYLDDTDFDSANWVVRKLTGAIGIASPTAIAYTKQEALFVSDEGGVHLLSAVQDFGDVKASDLTAFLNIEKITKEEMNRNRMQYITCAYYEDKKQAWIGYTSKTGTTNDRILKLDFSNLTNIKATITTKDSCESIFIRKNSSGLRKPLLGTSTGFVRTTDDSNRAVNSSAYIGRFQTPFLTFENVSPELKTQAKLFDFLEIEAAPVGNHAIAVDVFIDGNYFQTLFFNMGAQGGALDSFILDTDRVDGTGITNKKKRLFGSGRSISYSVYNSGLNQDFQIASLTTYFRVGSEDLR